MKEKLIKLIPNILFIILIIQIILTVTSYGWLSKFFTNINKGVLFYILIYALSFLISFVIYQSYILSNIIRTNRFELKQINNLKNIIYTLICCFFLLIFMALKYDFITFGILTFVDVIVILLLIVLKEVFENALGLQKEIDHTI